MYLQYNPIEVKNMDVKIDSLIPFDTLRTDIKKFVPYISLNFNFNFEIFFKRLKRLINSKNKSNIEGVTLILYIKNATIIKSANIKNKSSKYRCILSKISLINVVPPTWTHNLYYTFFFVFFIIDFQLITRLRYKTAV